MTDPTGWRANLDLTRAVILLDTKKRTLPLVSEENSLVHGAVKGKSPTTNVLHERYT